MKSQVLIYCEHNILVLIYITVGSEHHKTFVNYMTRKTSKIFQTTRYTVSIVLSNKILCTFLLPHTAMILVHTR